MENKHDDYDVKNLMKIKIVEDLPKEICIHALKQKGYDLKKENMPNIEEYNDMLTKARLRMIGKGE